MFEKHKYTGKHRQSDKNLTPAYEVIEKASYYSEADTQPIDTRPLTSTESIQQANTASEAFQEVIAVKDSDAEQSIKNIDLAVKSFGAESFSESEKEALSEIIIEKSDEIINKSNPDFTDPFTLGFAVDTLNELDSDTSDTATQPILNAIVTVAESLTEIRNKNTVTVSLNPEEAAAITNSVTEFRHLPDSDDNQLMTLIDQHLRDVSADRFRSRNKKTGAVATRSQHLAYSAVDDHKKAA